MSSRRAVVPAWARSARVRSESPSTRCHGLRAIPGHQHGRERPVRADRRSERVEAPAAGAGSDPDLLGSRVGGPDVERDRLEAAHADGEQALVVAPGRPADVHTMRVDGARLARCGVDQQQLAGHDHAIAADRLDHGGMRPGGRPAGPAELHLAAPQCARVARDGIDQGQLGAVPGTLARALGDDCDDRAVAAPGRLPDVQVDGRGGRELAARDVQHVERATAIPLALARLDQRNPIRNLDLGAECARAESSVCSAP